jgi:hypothetical protein
VLPELFPGEDGKGVGCGRSHIVVLAPTQVRRCGLEWGSQSVAGKGVPFDSLRSLRTGSSTSLAALTSLKMTRKMRIP